MTELVITLKDASYLPRKKRLSRYEQAMLDVKEGRVYEAKDVDDLFKQIL